MLCELSKSVSEDRSVLCRRNGDDSAVRVLEWPISLEVDDKHDLQLELQLLSGDSIRTTLKGCLGTRGGVLALVQL